VLGCAAVDSDGAEASSEVTLSDQHHSDSDTSVTDDIVAVDKPADETNVAESDVADSSARASYIQRSAVKSASLLTRPDAYIHTYKQIYIAPKSWNESEALAQGD